MSNNDNLWVVHDPKQGQVPVGAYMAEFKGVSDHELPNKEMRWRFTWAVKSGPESGKTASALTNRSITANSLPGVLIAGLLGRAIKSGENVKTAVDSCIGKSYLVTVQVGPKGGKPGVRACNMPPAM